jgi:hypothetical protein
MMGKIYDLLWRCLMGWLVFFSRTKGRVFGPSRLIVPARKSSPAFDAILMIRVGRRAVVPLHLVYQAAFARFLCHVRNMRRESVILQPLLGAFRILWSVSGAVILSRRR